MENMDKGLTVPKWVLMNRPKIAKMPQNLSAQNVCPSQKFGILITKDFIGSPYSVINAINCSGTTFKTQSN
jgi:hypothetical protein